jgi:hypothetical protein
MYRCDREISKGGGALLMVSNDFLSKSLDLSAFFRNSKIDAIACVLSLHNSQSLGCLCIYRPPNSSISDDDSVYKVIKVFLNYNFEFNLILGDFNYPDIIWPCSASSSQSESFINFCQENFLQQHVTSATRRKSNAILDLIFTTTGTNILNLTINEELHNSDHSILQFSVPLRPLITRRKILRRNLRRLDSNKFQNLLSNFPDWVDMIRSNDIELIWNQLLQHINACLDKLAPYRVISRRNILSSSKVRTALRHKRRLFRRYISNPTIDNLSTYLNSVNITNQILNEDIIYRENRILTTPEQKMFWSYVNQRLTNNKTIKSILLNNRELVDQSLIANAFNSYFASNFSPSLGVNLPTNPSLGSLNNLASFSISMRDLVKILQGLPSKTTTDNDGLSYYILKSGGSTLASFLLDLFSCSLHSGQIPSAWKKAVVTPIHKDGPKNLVSNYRPISVTSCCSRILERIIRNQLADFLSYNDLIGNSQHGFQRGKSTDTALLHFYDYVTQANDNGQIVDAVFFDFAKAFDKVPHDVLINRIFAHQITGKALTWLTDFLTNRLQIVKIGYSISDPVAVSSGIVQGSVLGPTLFNIFINNIDLSVNYCPILKYADDIRIFLASNKDDRSLLDLSDNIQSDVNSITDWVLHSRMSFNTNKCFVVNFGKSRAPRDYFINDTIIPNKNVFRDLGVTVCTPLTFNKHVDSIVSKAFSRLGLINKVFLHKTKKSVLLLFKAYVRPILEYSSIIWNPYTARNINKIERVQKRMCKMISGVRHLSYQQQLEALNILSLQARRLRFQLISVFKIYKQSTNVRFSDFFSLAKSKMTRGHNAAVNIKHAYTNYRLNFFTLSILEIWNKLPQTVIDSPNLLTFKIGIASFFRSHDIW